MWRGKRKQMEGKKETKKKISIEIKLELSQ